MLNKANFWVWSHVAVAAATAAVMLILGTASGRADDHLDTFRVGGTVYSNVTVMTKTSVDIFFKHSYGFGNAKVRDVERPVLLKLGYQLPGDDDSGKSVLDQSAQNVMESAVVTNLVADPRVQEAQAMLNDQLGDVLDKITPQVIYGIVAAVIGLYLFHCFCCRQICVKVSQAGSKPDNKLLPLIWVPVLRQIPLLRAAGLPVWLVVAVVLPPVWLGVQIWWSFKIAEARGKSRIVGVLLILPFTYVFAFLHLAFSGVSQSQAAAGNVISLAAPPRRAAA